MDPSYVPYSGRRATRMGRYDRRRSSSRAMSLRLAAFVALVSAAGLSAQSAPGRNSSSSVVEGVVLDAATERPVDFWGMVMVKVRDGQLIEGWNCFEFLSMYQQLGWVHDPVNPL